MIGTLNTKQIEGVLNSQLTGRIGCYGRGRIYVVPFTFAYEGNYIYGHSHEGEKIRMMRRNPNVCFQTDIIENMCNWRSVIVWGRYEEMKELKDQVRTLKILGRSACPLCDQSVGGTKS